MCALSPRSSQLRTQTQLQLHLSQSQLNHQSQSQLMHTSLLSCSGFTSEVDLSRLARSTSCSPAPGTRSLRAAAVAEDLPVEGPILHRQGSRPTLHGGLAGQGAGCAAVQFGRTADLGDSDVLLASLASPLLSPICSYQPSPPPSATNSMQLLSSESWSASMAHHHGGSATPSLPSRPTAALQASSPSTVPTQRSRNASPTPVRSIESKSRHLPVPVAVETLLPPATRPESCGTVGRGVTLIREPLGPVLAEPVAVGVANYNLARHCATSACDLGPALGSSSSPRQSGRAATFFPLRDPAGTSREWDVKADVGNATTVAAEGLNQQPRLNGVPQTLPPLEVRAGPPLTGAQPSWLAGVASSPNVPYPRLAEPVARSVPLPASSQTSTPMARGDIRQQPMGALHSVPTETSRFECSGSSVLPHFPVPTLVPRSRPNLPQASNETSTAPLLTHKGGVVVSDTSITRLPLDEEALETDEAAEVSNMDISADMPSPKSLVCPALQLSLGEATSPRTPQWPPAGGDTTTTGASTPTTSGSSGATCAGFVDGVTDIEAKCRLARDPCDRPTTLPWASTRRPASPQIARKPWPTPIEALQVKSQPSSRDEAVRDLVKEHGKPPQREVSVDAALARTLVRLNGHLQLLENLVDRCEKWGGQ